jgi:hypothetical protein
MIEHQARLKKQLIFEQFKLCWLWSGLLLFLSKKRKLAYPLTSDYFIGYGLASFYSFGEISLAAYR